MDANCVCSAPVVRRSTPEDEAMTTRLEKIYKEQVVPALMEKFGYGEQMQGPKLVKNTVIMGVGEAATNKEVLENAVADLAEITGQKPVTTKARVSVASVK